MMNLPSIETVNHIVVFMTGAEAFPESLGGGVFLYWPQPEPSWQYLGFISNQKPSAFFRLSKLKHSGVSAPGIAAFGGVLQSSCTSAQIAIAVEPLAELLDRSSSSGGQDPTDAAGSTLDLTQRLLENFFNYVSSFAATPPQLSVTPDTVLVPFSSVQSWYLNLQNRLNLDPMYLRKA